MTTTDGPGGPPPLSVAIVCCNNERTLGRVLDSVRGVAREIVAVDSGSSDGSIAMLERAGARVVRQAWLGFVKQKQFALERCVQPWTLHLDSDESLTPELRRSIERALTAAPAGLDGYEVNRVTWYAGRPLRRAWQPEWRLRLVRTDAARWAGLDPHDRMELTRPGGVSGRLRGALRHDSISTIDAFLAKQAAHGRVAAESALAEGRSTSTARLVTSPAGAWLKQVVARGAWRDGWRGWVAAGAAASASFMKHAAMLERQRAGDAEPGRGPRGGDAP